MLMEQTLASMRAISLLGMSEALEEQMRTPAAGKLSFEDRIGLLIEREQLDRNGRRFSRLLEETCLARADGSWGKLLEKLARTDLLAIDDYGMAPLEGVQRMDFLEMLEDRYGKRATVITAQLPVEHWHEVAGDPTFGDAILDRLVNNAYRIALKGPSLRKRYGKIDEETTRKAKD